MHRSTPPAQEGAQRKGAGVAGFATTTGEVEGGGELEHSDGGDVIRTRLQTLRDAAQAGGGPGRMALAKWPPQRFRQEITKARAPAAGVGLKDEASEKANRRWADHTARGPAVGRMWGQARLASW